MRCAGMGSLEVSFHTTQMQLKGGGFSDKAGKTKKSAGGPGTSAITLYTLKSYLKGQFSAGRGSRGGSDMVPRGHTPYNLRNLPVIGVSPEGEQNGRE